MKWEWFRSFKMEGRTLKESWQIAIHDPAYLIFISIVVAAIVFYFVL